MALQSGGFHVKRSNHDTIKFIGIEKKLAHYLLQTPTKELKKKFRNTSGDMENENLTFGMSEAVGTDSFPFNVR